MNKPLALAFGGAAVLVAGIAIYVQLNQNSAPVETTPASKPSPTERPTAGSGPRGSASNVVEGSHPKTPDGEAAPTREPTVTTVDGVTVRDHRGNRSPIDIPPTIHRPKSRQIASTVTHEITQKVVNVLNECAKSMIPKEARGTKPRAEGQIVVAVKDKILSITKATVKLRDVEGGEPAQKCIEDRSVGLTVPAKDEGDVESYEISVSFAVL